MYHFSRSTFSLYLFDKLASQTNVCFVVTLEKKWVYVKTQHKLSKLMVHNVCTVFDICKCQIQKMKEKKVENNKRLFNETSLLM